MENERYRSFINENLIFKSYKCCGIKELIKYPIVNIPLFSHVRLWISKLHLCVKINAKNGPVNGMKCKQKPVNKEKGSVVTE
jgi:hypothetical protein